MDKPRERAFSLPANFKISEVGYSIAPTTWAAGLSRTRAGLPPRTEQLSGLEHAPRRLFLAASFTADRRFLTKSAHRRYLDPELLGDIARALPENGGAVEEFMLARSELVRLTEMRPLKSQDRLVGIVAHAHAEPDLLGFQPID